MERVQQAPGRVVGRQRGQVLHEVHVGGAEVGAPVWVAGP
jgi:hypothetical protein